MVDDDEWPFGAKFHQDRTMIFRQKRIATESELIESMDCRFIGETSNTEQNILWRDKKRDIQVEYKIKPSVSFLNLFCIIDVYNEKK